MSYFDQRPQLFRILFGIVAAVLVMFAGYNIYRFGKSPSDENIFQNPPARAYITRSLPADLSETSGDRADSIRIGDLILSVNGSKFPSLKEGLDYVSTLNDTSLLIFAVARPPDMARHTYSVRKSLMSPDYVRDLQPTALVVDVTPGGASDRAGLRVGDHITRINGREFKNVGEADAILRQGQIGNTIDYEIIRNNEILTLHVTLASFGLQFGFLLFFLSGLVYVSTGIFLAEARPQYAATRLLGVFFLVVGYVMAVSIVSRGSESPLIDFLRRWSLVIGLLTGFAVSLHSTHYFPQERPNLIRRRWLRISGYVFSLISLVCVIVLPAWGPAAVVITNGVYVFFVPILFRKDSPVEYRRMNQIVRWTGIGIGASSFAFGFIVGRQGDFVALRFLGPFGLLLMAMPLAYLVTIGRYQLFNLVFRIRRGVQYSFVSITWLLATILVFMVALSLLVQAEIRFPYVRITSSSIEIVDTPASREERNAIERGTVAALAIGLTFTIMRLHKSGGRFLSQKFHRAQYDYRQMGRELAEVMSSTLSMTHLAKGIVERLASLMKLKRVGLLFFRDQQVCCAHEAYGFDGSTWEEFCLGINDQWVDGLKPFDQEVRVDMLPGPLKAALASKEFFYVVPIWSKERLVGAMLIGEKMSESAFTPEDREFLGAVARQASVAIENAFLYEELAEQERLKHELAIARRIQLESLPQTTPDVAGLQVAGISIPALEVGGDYYDYLNGDARTLTVIVGDVSGKGTSAALYMSKVQGILRSLHAFGLSPRELFIRANYLLCKDLEKRSFITAMGGTFKPAERQLTLSRAGHLPLFHYSTKTKHTSKIIPRGLGLGLAAQNIFADELEETTISYDAGDVFVFVTDGITEGQRESGEEFGEERLMELLTTSAHATAEQIKERLIAAVEKFAQGARQHDDQTVVVVRAM